MDKADFSYCSVRTHVVKERVQQSVAPMARPRVTDNPRRFVHDEAGTVLKENVETPILTIAQ